MPDGYKQKLIPCTSGVVSDPPPQRDHPPNVAPSDFHFFGALKDAFSDTRMTNIEEVSGVIKAWIRGFSTEFFESASLEWVQR